MVERKKGRHLFLPPQKKLDIIVQEINAKKQTKEMASMGDDQEENIEMWKIKKVRRRGLLRGFLFFVGVFFVFLFLFVVGDGVVRRRRRRCVFKSPEMMWSLFVLSLSLSLSRPRRPLSLSLSFWGSGRDRTARSTKPRTTAKF